MNKRYATINIQKINTLSELCARYKHNRRIKVSSNVVAERSDSNIHGRTNIYKRVVDRIEKIKQIRKESGARALRKTAVPAVELVLGASGEWFKDKSDDEVKDWAKAQWEWAKDYYKGRAKLVGYDIHNDETNPHMHIIMLPEQLKLDKSTGEKLPVLSAKTVQGNKVEMNKMRDSHSEAMKRFGLERGRNYYLEGEESPNYTDGNSSVKQFRRSANTNDRNPRYKRV